MPGGEIQLSALGAHDLYLTDNPQISFFKAVYKRYTFFAQQLIVLDDDNVSNTLDSFTQARVLKYKFPRNADLIKEVFIQLTLPAIYSSDAQQFQWIRRIGEYLVREARVIGGDSRIYHRLRGEYLHIYAETHTPGSKKPGYYRRIGHLPELYDPANSGSNAGFYPARTLPPNTDSGIPSIPETNIIIRLPFWFSEHSGTALPLIALQKMEFRLEVEIRPLNELYTILDTNPQSPTFQTRIRPILGSHYLSNFTNTAVGDSLPNTRVVAQGNYIFLDREERKRFAQAEHRYLMKQVQYYNNTKSFGAGGGGTFTVDMKDINHPVTQLFFMVRRSDNEETNQWSNYTCWEFVGQNLVNPLYTPGFISQYNNNFIISNPNAVSTEYSAPDIISETEMKFNSDNRYDRIRVEYMDLMRDYFNGQGSYNDECQGIYGYSFSLDNDKFQPSGTCNFSRLGKKQLLMYFKDLISRATRDTSRGLPFNNSYSVILIAESVNFFRIIGGLAGQEFEN